jgi:hypothetical protein
MEKVFVIFTPKKITRVIRSRRMRLAVYVACMGKRRRHTGFWLENLRERDHWEILDVDVRIIIIK